MGTFRLEPLPLPDENAAHAAGADGLTDAVLLNNARWFTRIRWIAVAVVAAFGLAGCAVEADVLARFGLRPPGVWPFWVTGVLVLLNLVSIGWIRRLASRSTSPRFPVKANTWFQVVSDLLVLSVLVYRVGTTTTVIPFAYVFHITLACIFFGRRDSLLVTLLSVFLFLATVSLELAGVLPAGGVLVTAASSPPGIQATALFAIPTAFVWLIVWYLVSSLSDAVRQRDRELDAANRRILKADEEINLQMLRVTHDLKAPFSGIESNIQTLKQSHWDQVPEPVQQIISRIDGRSAALRARIADILTLGNLRSARVGERPGGPVDLKELLESIVQDLQGLAASKQVNVEFSGDAVTVSNDPVQLKVLFANLVSNAIVYSHNGGAVQVDLRTLAGQACVRVVDHGIGIAEKALPHVFGDFYRTPEAAAFNPNSTGLGLAIVRQVARNLRLVVSVESEPGKGTAFQVFIPAGGEREGGQ